MFVIGQGQANCRYSQPLKNAAEGKMTGGVCIPLRHHNDSILPFSRKEAAMSQIILSNRSWSRTRKSQVRTLHSKIGLPWRPEKRVALFHHLTAISTQLIRRADLTRADPLKAPVKRKNPSIPVAQG